MAAAIVSFDLAVSPSISTEQTAAQATDVLIGWLRRPARPRKDPGHAD